MALWTIFNSHVAITGLGPLYGMSPDLSGFLAAYAVIFDGDPILGQWSIGGPMPNVIGGVVGYNPQGISYSHNKYEGDGSPTRPDLYQYGNNYKVVISQFQQLVDIAQAAGTDNYNVEILTQFNEQRVEQQIASNPYFFSGTPF